jgi:asparagine synthase (glutamine-hydrolysing)
MNSGSRHQRRIGIAMCGICGFNWRDDALLGQMTALLEHRGPDAHGFYAAERASLGHRRLSIVDLTECGRQPLANEDGTVWVTYNGEIYNHLALRHELEAKGHVFRSRTDSEVIVHAYEEYGPECVRRFTGMFAFGIWDARRRRFVLARDRLGLKPLYYVCQNGKLAFASEIKALLCDPSLPREVDPQALFDLMGYEFVPAPATLLRHVRKLLPGCVLVVEADGRSRMSRYWSLEPKDVRPTADELLGLLAEVCADHTMSDVPLGSFLSGGIDSSTVVGLLVSALKSPPQTFALGYAEESFSEFEYARRVARFFGTEHRELLVRPMDAEAITRSVWHLDEPTTDPSNLPFMLICEQARRWVKVCLSGDGGDELLMGYDRFRASKAARLLDAVPVPFRGRLYRALIGLLPDDDQKKGPRNILKRFLQGAVLPRSGEHLRWQYFMDPEVVGQLFRPDFLARIDRDPFAPLAPWAAQAPRERGRREQFIELHTVLPDSVLMKVDKMSMAHGLEVRPPLLDHRVVEFCYSLPTALKLRGFTTKWLLKEAVADRLPPGIAHRKKQGFSFPMKTWMRGELMEFTRNEIFGSTLIAEYFEPKFVGRLWAEHQAKVHNHSHLLWTMLNLALWSRLFGRRAAAPTIGQTGRCPRLGGVSGARTAVHGPE